jgi:hypothetical protein
MEFPLIIETWSLASGIPSKSQPAVTLQDDELPQLPDDVLETNVAEASEFTVTVLVTAEEGPLQPVLTTFIVTLPAHPIGQVTMPVFALIAEDDRVPAVFVIPDNDHDKVPVVAVLL